MKIKAKEKTKKKAKETILPQPVDSKNILSKPAYLCLSFVSPAVILGTVFALNGVYPFGGKQILNFDFFHQYYPFLNGLWLKLREGNVAPWSWTAGAGHDYISLIAYYMASPLNLLAFLAPNAWLREAFTVILLLKIGCAGLFTAIFLHRTYRQSGAAIPVFSSLYALCAFTLGYFHNIMWIDSFALLPLVMTGFLALMREGKFRLYVIALALSVLANYHIGFYVCVFVALSFIGECIIQKPKPRGFFGKLALTAAFSALAIGMSAVLFFPSFSILQEANTWVGDSPSKPEIFAGFPALLGNFIAFTPPTYVSGPPNLYCGMISVLLTGVFMQSSKVSRREKTVTAVLIVFLVLCCNVNALYYIINGFRFPYGYPFRFSFLVSFVLVASAYRAYVLTEDINKRIMLIMGLSAALILLAAAFGPQETKYVIASAGMCAVYAALFYSLGKRPPPNVQKFLEKVFLLLILAELSATSFIAIKTSRLTERDEYPDRFEEIQRLLTIRQSGPNDFYRSETNLFFTDNDPYLYNYNGLTFFSSIAKTNICNFLTGLLLNGIISEHSIIYNDITPLTNALLSVRYQIVSAEYPANNDIFWRVAGKAGDAQLLENRYYLPLGFMVNSELAAYRRYRNPAQSQNDFFRRATGLSGDLFTITILPPDEYSAAWNYEMPSDGMLYIFFSVEGDSLGKSDIENMPQFIPTGSFSKGQIISIQKGNALEARAVFFNSALFYQGYNILSGQTLNLTKFTNTAVCGSVTAPRDGLLYTSIPGDENWSVYVDGVKSELVLIDGAMASVRLNKGYHEIEFRYFNKSFLAGIIVSLVSLAVFLSLAYLPGFIYKLHNYFKTKENNYVR